MTFQVRDVVGLVIVAIFAGCILGLFLGGVPTENKEQIIFVLGQSSALCGLVAGYYFGSTKDEGGKTENTGKAFDAINAVAANGSGGVQVTPPATITTTVEETGHDAVAGR